MEEDIKMLEEYVQEFNENKKKYKLTYSTGFGKFWSDFVKAIENLINRNKQLEEIEKEHQKENGELRERVKELEKYENYYKNERVQLIPKLKVIKLKEKIDKEHDKAVINFINKKENFVADGDVAQTLNWVSGEIKELLGDDN